MKRSRRPRKPPWLPDRRPVITVTPSKARTFAVDRREVPGWFCVPEVGAHCVWATYDPPDWRMTSFTRMEVVRLARVHGVEGVEIADHSVDFEPDKGWVRNDRTMFARLTRDNSEWLGTFHLRSGKRVLYTFLDEGFDRDWGSVPRRIRDVGRLRPRKDGSFSLRVRGQQPWAAVGAGIFRVRIGPRSFTCLRVLDIDRPGMLSEQGILSEAYVTRAGRTVYWQRYNGRLWEIGKGSPYGVRPWDERLPDAPRLVINGATFVHWYDCLTNLSFGIRLAK